VPVCARGAAPPEGRTREQPATTFTDVATAAESMRELCQAEPRGAGTYFGGSERSRVDCFRARPVVRSHLDTLPPKTELAQGKQRVVALPPRRTTGVHATSKTGHAANFGRLSRGNSHMSTNGTIKRITDKGFGFIATNEGVEYFFHQSACKTTPFDEMREGESVTFTIGSGPKGPRAENVVRA